MRSLPGSKPNRRWYVDEMRSILKQLFSAYPHSQVGEGTAAMYYACLRDIPAKELEVVIRQCVAEFKFMPSVAEIREMHRRLAKREMLTAAEGWGLVRREIWRVGWCG